MSAGPITRDQLSRLIGTFKLPPELRDMSDPQGRPSIRYLRSFIHRTCVFHVQNGRDSATVPAEIAHVNLEMRDGKQCVVVKLYIGSLFDRDVDELIWTEADGWKARLFRNDQDSKETHRINFTLAYFEVLD